MHELTPGERALIDAARDAEDPSADVRKRVHHAVLARVAAAAVGTAVATASATTASAGLGLFGKLLIGVGVLAVAGGSALVATRAHDQPLPALGGMTPPAPEWVSETPEPRKEQAPAASVPLPEVPAQKTMRSESVDDLREETALLRRAQQALREGDAARALALLDAHAARFPSGALGPERRATRVLALCRLGRAGDARAEADGFLRQSPDSPMADRVRRACADE